MEDSRDHELEVIELGADRVQQDQCRRAGTRLQVPQTRPVAELGVLDLPRRGPCPGVVAVRPGFRSHRFLLLLFTRTSRATLAAASDVRNPGVLVDGHRLVWAGSRVEPPEGSLLDNGGARCQT